MLLDGLASGAVTLPPNGAPDVLDALHAALYRSDWVVYANAPFGGAEQGHAYLGRYTYRVGISNARLRSMDERGHRAIFEEAVATGDSTAQVDDHAMLVVSRAAVAQRGVRPVSNGR